VLPGERSATLVCRGHVERMVDPTDLTDNVVALSISHCRFGRVAGGAEPFET
jgi:hypothetical protein